MRTADYLVGIIIGLSLGYVPCNVVHASTEASCSDIAGVSSGCSFDDGIFPEKLTGGDIWGAGDNGQLRIVEVFPLCHGGEVDPLCYDTDAHNFVTSCQVQMEAAMRAREEWAALTDERDRWVLITEGTATITFSNPTITYDPFTYPAPMPEYRYEPDRRTDEERLADRQKELDEEKIALAKRREEQRIEAEKKQEKAGRIIVLKAQWEQAKACWRKP